MKCRNCGEPIELCVGPISGCNDGKTYRHDDGVMGLHACRTNKDQVAEPENECEHVQSRMLKVFRGYEFIPNEFCPKCGEKL